MTEAVSDSSFRVLASDKEGMVPRATGLLFFSIGLVASLFSADYTIKDGDTATSIARGAKISLALLVRANPGISERALKAGATLYLPDQYTVRAGDTLYSLSRTWSLDLADVQAFNGLNSTSGIHVGQILYIPKRNKVTAPPVATTTPAIPAREPDKAPLWPVERKPHPEGDKLRSVTFGTAGEGFRSVSAGTVVFQGEFRGVGRVLLVQSEDQTVFGYGNFESSSVVFGQSVVKGQLLGSTSGRPSQKLSFFAYKKTESLDVFTTKR